MANHSVIKALGKMAETVNPSFLMQQIQVQTLDGMRQKEKVLRIDQILMAFLL